MDTEIRNTLGIETAVVPNQRKANDVRVEMSSSLDSEKGVFLTWENLWLAVSDKRNGSRPILQGVTGYARPGEVLAIMGPSGCGKSTLLDTLAGRLGASTKQTGDILINGCEQELAYGASAYVTQDDTLMTTLTVREAVYYSALLQLSNSMSIYEKRERADMTIREMGLHDCVDTRIGGWGDNGISGGQKRRVSICIEILTRPKLLFLDEPTSGLDSAASYYVMRRIAKQDMSNGRTVLTSIHQPSSEVFSLFHTLCLLSSGRVVYFGPATSATEFFALNGLPCPTHMNPSDHFLRTINKDFDEDMEQSSAGKKPTEEVIRILVNSYKSSDCYSEVCRQVAEMCQKKDGGALRGRDRASSITQCIVLTRRSFVNMYRDLGYYWLRLAIYVFIAVGLGTMFYDVDRSYGSIQDRASMLMYVASFLTFMSIGGFPSFVEDMKVFGRERLNGHYGSSAFVIGNTFSSVPYLLLISLVPGAIAYFLTGLRGGFEHFVYFIAMIFMSTMLVESLMMIVASIVPNFLMGIVTGAGMLGVMILAGGFFRFPNEIPSPVWKYPLYHISLHKYAYQGLYKNEFQGLRFSGEKAGQLGIRGEEILTNRYHMEVSYSKWVDLSILAGMLVVYRFIFWAIIKIIETVKPALRKFMSVSPKQTVQVMVNPTATPLHAATTV